ncbi:MAG: tRNA 5-methoxyuridine(34)/uridine 5-oxyacetic acid(34) synthase CmoB [Halieaceae bacterium]|jgi:tRNA (mo5U34)-methyltransferase|nr:tRNA 5-methoxyuridine(34)/uridine 5-oxyacetic acid(34) synthase CmoB [Halieaceae bacterium]
MDVAPLLQRWRDSELAPWCDSLQADIARRFNPQRHGDLPRWQAALAALPALTPSDISLDSACIRVGNAADITDSQRAALEGALRELHPWRKGPFELFGLHIDTEWRSDWKWERLLPALQPLAGKRVLDVGCGSGYHCWRMLGAGASEVIGIDPTPLFVLQFQALKHYIGRDDAWVLPLGVEDMPGDMAAFDTVFSMGVLYHRRSPIEHLMELRGALREGGQLVLETLVVEGDASTCLVPSGRYARMGNVWFLPSTGMLLLWLEKLGYREPALVDVNTTSTAEQRSTDWMQFHSLANFLDPEDPARTIEGYPAPRRAIVTAMR